MMFRNLVKVVSEEFIEKFQLKRSWNEKANSCINDDLMVFVICDINYDFMPL